MIKSYLGHEALRDLIQAQRITTSILGFWLQEYNFEHKKSINTCNMINELKLYGIKVHQK